MPTNQINEIVYSDIDFYFNAHPVTKDVTVLRNVAAIKRSIRNLVLTNRYEKPFKPNVFSGVLEGLFENFDPILVGVLRDKVKEVLQSEPRAVIQQVNISNEDELDRNGINITIVFTPINRLRTEIVELFLNKVR